MPRKCPHQTVSASASGEGAGFNAAGRSCIFDERFPQVREGRHIPRQAAQEGTPRLPLARFYRILLRGNYRKSCVLPPSPLSWGGIGSLPADAAVTGRRRDWSGRNLSKNRGVRARETGRGGEGEGGGEGPWRRPDDEVSGAAEIRVINIRERAARTRVRNKRLIPPYVLRAGNCARCGGSRKLRVITCRKSRGDHSFFPCETLGISGFNRPRAVYRAAACLYGGRGAAGGGARFAVKLLLLSSLFSLSSTRISDA